MRFNPYSFSKISTHLQCPKKFQFCYIDKVKIPYKHNEALVKGSAVHSILEYFPEKSLHKYAEKYFDVAETYLKSPSGWELINKNAMKEFDLAFDSDFNLVDYKDKSAMFRGSVDRVIIEGNTLTLVDFKTGKFKDDYSTYGQTYEQLMYYSIWFFLRFPEVSEIKISYVYIEHPQNEPNTRTLLRENLDEIKFNLISNIYNIEKDEEFKKKTGPLCNYCDYQEHCNLNP